MLNLYPCGSFHYLDIAVLSVSYSNAVTLMLPYAKPFVRASVNGRALLDLVLVGTPFPMSVQLAPGPNPISHRFDGF